MKGDAPDLGDSSGVCVPVCVARGEGEHWLVSARSPSPWPQLAGASGQDRQELRPPRPLVLPDALGATQGASAVFWLSPADPAASQPGPGASELPPPRRQQASERCTAGGACWGARQHPRPPGSPGRVAAPRRGAATSRQPPPPQAVTFHFGEGKDRTVAGAERGHPGRVLLHDEPSACRSASADRLHPAAGRGAPLGPLRVASGAEERERLAAQALPPGLPAGLLSPRGSLRRPPLRAHLPRPRSHSTHAPTASCLEVAANSNVTYKCTPHAHPTGSPAPPPALGRPALQPGPSLQALSRLRLGSGRQGWPAAPLSALCRHQLVGGGTRELSLSVSGV